MLISFKDLKVGDEVVTPSYSNLNYLKFISKTKKGNYKFSRKVTTREEGWNRNIQDEQKYQKHNSFIYLVDYGYSDRDFFLVKRQ